MRNPVVYILSNQTRGTLYVGVTSALAARIAAHRSGAIPGFASWYGLRRLVYVEQHRTMEEAIRREKQLKEWHRAWKLRLIEEFNPEWRDLADEL
jgi:putative endonuclease